MEGHQSYGTNMLSQSLCWTMMNSVLIFSFLCPFQNSSKNQFSSYYATHDKHSLSFKHSLKDDSRKAHKWKLWYRNRYIQESTHTYVYLLVSVHLNNWYLIICNSFTGTSHSCSVCLDNHLFYRHNKQSLAVSHTFKGWLEWWYRWLPEDFMMLWLFGVDSNYINETFWVQPLKLKSQDSPLCHFQIKLIPIWVTGWTAFQLKLQSY